MSRPTRGEQDRAGPAISIATFQRGVSRSCLVALPLLGLGHLGLGFLRHPTTESAAFTALTGVRIVCTIAIVVTVVVGTGLCLRHWFGRTFLLGPAFVWLPGALLLAATGLVCWHLAERFDPQTVAVVVLSPVLATITIAAFRVQSETLFVPGEAAVCGLLVLLVLVGTAKATWSQSPEDELYGGTVSRTLEQGDRSDSRISYHVVQVTTHGLARAEPVSAAFFAPYAFSDRGPIAGLAATPVVASAGTEPPLSMPDQAWVPFDRQGFAAYRIALEVLAATIVLSVFGVLGALFTARVAWQGTLLVALTPFVVHEVYFTWPKLIAASFGVAALAALLRRRSVVAGLLLGLSYLAHPVGAFIAVGVVGVWLGRAWQERSEQQVAMTRWLLGVVRTTLPVVAGVAICALAWRYANRDDFHQGDRFGAYLYQARGIRAATFDDWLNSRFRSVGNTVVPFEMLRWGREDSMLTTTNTRMDGFTLQYWNTLPFAVGIVYFPLFCAGLVRFARSNMAVFLAGVVLPFLVFTVYWGSFVTGMMREGLQGWIVITLPAAFIGHRVSRQPRRWAAGLVRVCLTLRGVEVLVMLLATTVLSDGWLDDGPFLATDVAALATMVTAVGVMMALTWRALAPAKRDAARADVPEPIRVELVVADRDRQAVLQAQI